MSNNTLLIPIGLLFVAAIALLVFMLKVRREGRKSVSAKRLDTLKPPSKGRNHRCILPRPYYFTLEMAKPSTEDSFLLTAFLKLLPAPKPAVV